MTEALPMAVTALLPVVLMPWLDVMSSKQLCQNYLKVRTCLRNLFNICNGRMLIVEAHQLGNEIRQTLYSAKLA